MEKVTTIRIKVESGKLRSLYRFTMNMLSDVVYDMERDRYVLVGCVITFALLFVSSKDISKNIGERLLGSLALCFLSWFYVAIVVVYHLMKKKGGS